MVLPTMIVLEGEIAEIIRNFFEYSLKCCTVRSLVNSVNGKPRKKEETDFSYRPYSGKPTAAMKKEKYK